MQASQKNHSSQTSQTSQTSPASQTSLAEQAVEMATAEQPRRKSTGLPVWPRLGAGLHAKTNMPQPQQQALLAAFEARRAVGVKKYGHELHTNNGRCAITDAFQELLEASFYLAQAQMELGMPPEMGVEVLGLCERLLVIKCDLERAQKGCAEGWASSCHADGSVSAACRHSPHRLGFLPF